MSRSMSTSRSAPPGAGSGQADRLVMIRRGHACCLCTREHGTKKIAGLHIGPACIRRIEAIAKDAGLEVHL